MMVIFFLSVTLQANAKSYTQKVTLVEKNTPLNVVFEKISNLTGYDFLVSTENLKRSIPVTVNIHNEEIKPALEKVFFGQPLTFVIQEKMVVVSAKDKPSQKLDLKRGIISGKIIDPQGSALVGANIRVLNTTLATSSDKNGDFIIDNAPESGTIMVSFIGFTTVTILYDGQHPLSKNIILAEATGKLDAIQIIGYGQTTKRSSTGTISSISSQVIEKQPVTNVQSALSGRMPGVFVQTTNGLPGGNINIQIRGKNSLASGTSPLYIIDGVPFDATNVGTSTIGTSPVNGLVNPLNSINPSDIDDIAVLKDADATAIYGSRGTNGVILISTKKGKPGSTKTTLNVSQGISRAGNMPTLLSLQDYLAIRKEAFKNDNIVPTNANAADLLVWDQNKSTSWPQYLFGNTAHATDLQASLSGGTALLTFSASGNFHQENNVISNDASHTRGGGHFNLSYRSSDQRLTFDFSNSLAIDNNTSPNISNATNGLFLAPNFPLTDANGNYTLNAGNPIRDLNATAKAKTNNLLTNAIIGYILAPGLQLKLSTGYNRIGIDQLQLFPLRSLQSGTNYTLFGENTVQSFIAEPQLTYTKSISKAHLSFLIGGTYQDKISDNQFIKASTFANEGLMQNIASAATIDTRLNSDTEYKFASVFGRATFDWSGKYIFNATIRRDGSSRFGEEDLFGNFGSIGAAWLFSEENWVKNRFPVLSYGKIRASYGSTGNDQITDYQFLSTYSSPGKTYQGVSTLAPARVANGLFHWETTKKLEFALELGFFQDRLLFDLNYYRNRSGDQLVAYSLPTTTGFTSYQANLPAVVENTGWEFELNTVNLRGKDFKWSTAFNLTIPRNKLVSFENFDASSYSQVFEIGYDISRIRGYQFLNVDPQTGNAVYAGQNGLPNAVPYANYTVGKSSPDLYGGFGNTISYKHLSLDIFFQFTKQMLFGGIRNSIGLPLNNYAFMAARWQAPGDITSIPKPSTISDNFYTASSADYFDGSYIRLKNIAINYDLPHKWVSKINAQKAGLFVRAQNLLTIYHKNAAVLDPESGGYVAGQTNIPPGKSVIFGMSLTF